MMQPLIGRMVLGPHFPFPFGPGAVVPMMLIWLVAIGLVVWLLVASSNKQPAMNGYGPATPVTYDPALQIVRERYARGEIDKATYEQLVAELLRRS